MLLVAAFTAGLLVIASGSTGTVLPPANVTVSCHNLNVIARWAYSDQEPRTTFGVFVGGSESVTSGPLETTEQEFDLSPFVWTSLESLLGFHFVSVAAMGGGRPSENTTRTFTFNKYKGANVVCSLDFPPVDVDVEGSRATVTFPNPLHYYEPLKKVTRGNGATVAFTVSFEAGQDDCSCSVDQKTCKCDIVFPEEVETKCLTLTGQFKYGVSYVTFRETERTCAQSDGPQMIFFVALLASFVVVVTVLVFTVVKVKAWTMEVPALPKPLMFTGVREQQPEGNRHTDVSVVRVAVDRRPSTCSEDRRLAAERRSADGESEETECFSLDFDSEEDVTSAASGYDCPHSPQVDMGDGDLVTCYSRRSIRLNLAEDGAQETTGRVTFHVCSL